MEKKNIVIVGYPKSGTTWMSKLVAEIIQCPLYGNWGFNIENDPIREGEDRISEYTCYKSHHLFHEISKVSKQNIHSIIYIVRDPRDVVISGVYFFNFFKRISFINNLLPKKIKKSQMIKAILYGNYRVSQWCKTSWKEHYKSYIDKEVIFVKYEDLLEKPLIECKRILDYLNIQKDEDGMISSIEKQSIKNVKKTKNVRKGESGYWKKQFSNSENNLFINHMSDDLNYFGYLKENTNRNFK